ncbi:Protein slowmo [Orchesella cincta]|uniref:Protein slowmo n=1 Tax=Orchesella cincta TaxID=48709 RepID=A0A1D2NF73_ORCCI|nr:Protein slowmo [Orchesella cincta]
MKFWTSEYTFNHPWDKVVQAAWRKYPNPMNPAVASIDVLDRTVDEKGVLHTHRILSSKWGIPAWVQNIMGSPNIMYSNEKSEVDPNNKTMVLKSRNITFCSNIAVDEHLVYAPHPNDPAKTLLKQEAVVLVKGVPLSSYMESLLTTTISTNANKGRQAMNWVISKIDEELKDLSNSASKSTDEFIHHTKKSIDDITVSAKKSMDDLSSVAKKSLDDLLPSSSPSGPQTLPKF